MAEKNEVKKPEEVKAPVVKKPKDDFVQRKLRAINSMQDSRKAKELAERVMRNSRKGKN